jgi:hypothetical protein
MSDHPLYTITLDYKDENNALTGSFKVMCLPYECTYVESTSTKAPTAKQLIVPSGASNVYNINQDGSRRVWNDLIGKTSPSNIYPEFLMRGLRCSLRGVTVSNNIKDQLRAFWGDSAVVKWTYDLYKSFAKTIPIMMAYRFYDQIFSKYTSWDGKNVVNYTDDDLITRCMCVPINNVDNMDDLFETSFNTIGNLDTGNNQFAYDSCVIDLDPSYAGQGFKPSKFPMSFGNIKQVNSDEYKTSKLVLQRIDSISSSKFDSFIMGSHVTDYAEVTDELKKKYKEGDSITEGSADDYAQVTLGNGGSYQKQRVDVNLNDVITLEDFNKKTP